MGITRGEGIAFHFLFQKGAEGRREGISARRGRRVLSGARKGGRLIVSYYGKKGEKLSFKKEKERANPLLHWKLQRGCECGPGAFIKGF